MSSMDVHVSNKTFLAFPDSDDVVSQPLNAWKNWNTEDWSGPKLLAIWWIGMNLNDLPAPSSIKSLRVPADDVKDVFVNFRVGDISLWLVIFLAQYAPSAIHLPCPKWNSSLLLLLLIHFFDEQRAKNDRILWIKNISDKTLFLSYNSKWINKCLYCMYLNKAEIQE